MHLFHMMQTCSCRINALSISSRTRTFSTHSVSQPLLWEALASLPQCLGSSLATLSLSHLRLDGPGVAALATCSTLRQVWLERVEFPNCAAVQSLGFITQVRQSISIHAASTCAPPRVAVSVQPKVRS